MGHTTTNENRSAIFQNRVSNFQFDLPGSATFFDRELPTIMANFYLLVDDSWVFATAAEPGPSSS